MVNKKPKILPEPFVQKSIIKYLAQKRWSSNLSQKGLNEQGVDIKVKDNKVPRYWLIEVKGDPTIKAKSPSSSRSSTFHSALAQIITRMHTNRKKKGYKYGYKYGIGFPISFRDKVIKNLPYDVCYKLNLYVFFVDSKGVVEELDHKKLKPLREKLVEFSKIKN